MSSKLQVLKKQVIREAGLRAGYVVIAFIAMMVTGSFSETASTEKMQAQGQLSASESQLGMMRSQITKTNSAEQRFAELSINRDNEEFVTTTDRLKETLKVMKEQYRLSDAMRLTISQEKISERPEFTGLNYKILVRDEMEISTGTLSDLHFFSFIQDMQRRMPGLIRIKQMSVLRKSQLSMDVLGQMSTGGKPDVVDGVVKFTWLTLQDANPPKTGQGQDANAPNAAPPTAGGM
ncbi:MAG: hypothetical protein J0M34_04070 [Alphaproteobacteria bacterium]|nr:hypothetical protein [Alphaproteobacteria bacterium]